MANKLNPSFPIPYPLGLPDRKTSDFLSSLISSLVDLERTQTLTMNAIIDEQTAPLQPVGLKAYAKAALPDVAKYVNGMIIVTDDVGGRVPAFSDGTNWRRVTDRNIIS